MVNIEVIWSDSILDTNKTNRWRHRDDSSGMIIFIHLEKNEARTFTVWGQVNVQKKTKITISSKLLSVGSRF